MCPESFSRHLCPPLRPPRLTLLGVTGQVWPIMLGGGGAKNGEIYPCTKVDNEIRDTILSIAKAERRKAEIKVKTLEI